MSLESSPPTVETGGLRPNTIGLPGVLYVEGEES